MINPETRGGIGMRGRPGFTILEMLVVCVILGLVAAAAAPAISTALVRTKVRQAANVVAADLTRAFTLASRARHPVQISFDTEALTYRMVDKATGNLISERRFGNDSEYGLAIMVPTVELVDILPTGFASFPNSANPGPLEVTVGVSGHTRKIRMTLTGRVQVSG